MSTHLETIVIGAGQAGLATAYQLRQSGRDCLVVDAASRVGDGWRNQWDSLRLYSPAKHDSLPGMPFPADPWHFPGKDEVADYLETYARELALPVRLDTRVSRLSGATAGGFVVETDGGDFHADHVVVATGTFGRRPHVPDYAADLDPGIVQLHSSEYRRPSQLPDGPVLVVGASHSGFDVAYEVAPDHPTILAGAGHGEIPVPHGSRRFRMVMPVMWFIWGHVINRRTPVGRKEMHEIRFHGGPALRVKVADLEARGVERVEERVTGVQGGRPVLGSGRAVDAATVVWATGFTQDFGWIDVPGVIGEDGWPRELRGVVAAAPGLYFCGLSMQSSFRSMLIGGVGADAAHVARQIDRQATRATVTTDATRPARRHRLAA
jgi:putative flavoprotein involved in K+ transport